MAENHLESEEQIRKVQNFLKKLYTKTELAYLLARYEIGAEE